MITIIIHFCASFSQTITRYITRATHINATSPIHIAARIASKAATSPPSASSAPGGSNWSA